MNSKTCVRCGGSAVMPDGIHSLAMTLLTDKLMTRADYKKYLADPDEMDELTTLFYKPIQVDICHRCERAWLAIRANVSDDGVYKAFQRFATSKAKLELVAA